MFETAPFRLQTLGSLRLLAPNGEEVPSLANRRYKLALLALLAITRKPMSRDRLVDMFWGDRAEERARHSLSDALSQLRRVLGNQAIRARQSEIVLADDAPISVDLRELADAAAARDWGRVLTLHEAPFLDGVHVEGSAEWEHWVFAQRRGAERLFEVAARHESERLEAAGQWAALEQVSSRWLAHSPLEPLAACRTFTAIARGGPTAPDTLPRLRDVYDSLTLRLSAEHGVAPAGEVLACHQRLVRELEQHRVVLEVPMAPANPPHGLTLPVPQHEAQEENTWAAEEPPRGRSGVRLLPPLVGTLALVGALAVIAIVRDSPPPALEALTTTSAEARRLAELAVSGNAPRRTRAQAIALLERAVTIDSGFAMAHRTLALLWEGDGTRSAQVADALTRAVAFADRVTPYERESILSSYHLLVSADYVQAAEHQRALLQLAPDDADAWHELGMTYEYLGDHQRAAVAYRQALSRDRSSAATWSNLVDALYAAGEVAATEAAIDSMALAIPGHPSVFSATARVRAAAGDLAAAEAQARAYLAATAARPRSQGIGEMLLSRILWSQGRIDEGDAAVRRGIEFQLQVADSVMALRESLVLAAGAYWIRHDATLSKRRLKEALRRFPLETLPVADRPYLELATAQALAGETEAATQSLEAYDGLVTSAARRRNLGTEALARGTLALQSGRLRSAVTLLNDAATVDCPACGLPELGIVYAMLGKPDSTNLVQERYLAYQSLRRTDLQDALHRRRLEAQRRRLTD